MQYTQEEVKGRSKQTCHEKIQNIERERTTMEWAQRPEVESTATHMHH